ncbi:hypothetical protein [Aureimonas pseudogalii]|uniref:Ectoine hydroxylase-related dioxygenase (Phytanoyl-CoA dioxygenase family) n=1 Tax=Aureimonas pseudogalii TaxID=1744844 RepID=A0A7W6EAC9_9HYPH|nr:hypothetical protein [Aureimonas pseudogalii]MBB3997239.1 ectoine hydroxylase-related dioxygenase (phytanoyl-CoA dioxygenase family) [Aureimonas pseudogalii]
MSDLIAEQHAAFERYRVAKLASFENSTTETERRAEEAWCEFERVFCTPSNVIPFKRSA